MGKPQGPEQISGESDDTPQPSKLTQYSEEVWVGVLLSLPILEQNTSHVHFNSVSVVITKHLQSQNLTL